MIGAVERYLDLRGKLGYIDRDLSRDLRSFAAFADARGSIFLREADALAWAERSSSVEQRRILLACIGRLGRFLKAEDDRHDVLSEEYTRNPRVRPRLIPYIYGDDEIVRLLNGFAELPRMRPFNASTYRVIIGAIAATGMRLSEALSLELRDLGENTFYVRKGKFGKDRLVYLHITTAAAVREYVTARPPDLDSDKLFVIHTNSTPAKSVVEKVFRRCTEHLGILGRPDSGPPRIHDLRHTFAVRSLMDCWRSGSDISNHMVALSTHLGHVKAKDTFWYLQITTEMKAEIIEKVGGTFHGPAKL